MFHLIKGIIWLIGLIVVSSFILRFFHYEINWTAVENSFRSCYETVSVPCQNILVNKATETDRTECNARCLAGFSSWVNPQKINP
ncbi:MAG: hypothetical protein WCG84_01865 [Candidatus Moraniibacteriota bacterium]